MEKIKVTDELLAKVLPKLSDEMIKEWEDNADENHQFSKRFERKMKTLIWKEKNAKLIKELSVVGKIAATLFIVIGAAFAFTTMNTQANPQVLFEKIEIELDGATMYIYDEELDNYNFTPYEPTYVPKGYKEVDRSLYDNMLFIKYNNQEGKHISWRQKLVTKGDILGLDAEYDDKVILEYAGENVHIQVYNEGFKGLYYESGNSVFIMTSEDISIEDMYKMIRDMKKIEK